MTRSMQTSTETYGPKKITEKNVSKTERNPDAVGLISQAYVQSAQRLVVQVGWCLMKSDTTIDRK